MGTEDHETVKDRLFSLIYEMQEADMTDRDILSALQEVTHAYQHEDE